MLKKTVSMFGVLMFVIACSSKIITPNWLPLTSELPSTDGMYFVLIKTESREKPTNAILFFTELNGVPVKYWHSDILLIENGVATFFGCRPQTGDCSDVDLEKEYTFFRGYPADIYEFTYNKDNIAAMKSYFFKHIKGKKHHLYGKNSQLNSTDLPIILSHAPGARKLDVKPTIITEAIKKPGVKMFMEKNGLVPPNRHFIWLPEEFSNIQFRPLIGDISFI